MCVGRRYLPAYDVVFVERLSERSLLGFMEEFLCYYYYYYFWSVIFRVGVPCFCFVFCWVLLFYSLVPLFFYFVLFFCFVFHVSDSSVSPYFA